MYSWSGIGVPTTKAIIREIRPPCQFDTWQGGFFYLLRRLLRGGRPLEQIGVSLGVRTTLSRTQGTGSIFYENLHPYALDFWIFWAIPSPPTEQETFVSRPVVSASIPQKPLSLAFPIP